jgi:hypothetical protein
MLSHMTEHHQVIADLTGPGILAAIRWAYESATRRSLDSYSEADGHDAAWLGNTRFTLFRDRLDRVFSCQRYAVTTDVDGTSHLDTDVLHGELAARDIATLPRLAPGLVRRADLHGSAGWAYRGRRFLIASGEFGHLDTLPWADRSTTKQLVALQRNPDPHLRQPSLFEDIAADQAAGMDALILAADRQLDLVTYIVAHTLEPDTGQIELILGRPRLNLHGGPAWYWRQDLLTEDLRRPRRIRPPQTPAAATVPDAPVRLRRIDGGRRDAAS